MLESLGCKNFELDELWSLEDEALEQLKKSTNHVFGLIFLFQYDGDIQKQHAESKVPLSEDETPENLFFAHQVTTNACATQAILSVVLNAQLPEEQLGKVLSDFHCVARTFPPELKGVAIAGSEEIKQAHNAFNRSDAFLHEGKVYSKQTGEAFHFVAYLPVDNTVYELDGLQKGPIVVGSFGGENNDEWLTVARSAIQDRMRQIGADSGQVKFNIQAVIEDKRVRLSQELDETNDEDHRQIILQQLAQEESKREQWKIENQRRRHNFVPLAMALLKELARKKELWNELIQAASERQQARAALAKKSG
jgi:ubiquitin carboxyl-terminal hydrolase L5